MTKPPRFPISITWYNYEPHTENMRVYVYMPHINTLSWDINIETVEMSVPVYSVHYLPFFSSHEITIGNCVYTQIYRRSYEEYEEKKPKKPNQSLINLLQIVLRKFHLKSNSMCVCQCLNENFRALTHVTKTTSTLHSSFSH